MKQLSIAAGLCILGWLTWRLSMSLSSDALGMAVGVVFGVLAGIPSALLVLATSRRQNRADDDADYREQARRYPEPLPYQPPIIVLAAPMAQEPQTVNYTDNRSVTIHAPAQGGQTMPLIADRQTEVQAQQGGRVFRVVGSND